MEPQPNPTFQAFCYRLNDLGLYRLAAGLRYVLHKVIGAQYHEYEPVETKSHGYLGWFEHPRCGVLCFQRTDGTLQYKW